MESRKSSELLDLLDLNPNIGQKTLVITRSALEVEEVFKVKENFCFNCDVIYAVASGLFLVSFWQL